jgi:hypothetical protein
MELFAHGVLWPTVAAIAEAIATQEKTWFDACKKKNDATTDLQRDRSNV